MRRAIHRWNLFISPAATSRFGYPAYPADALAERSDTILVTAQRLDESARAEQAVAPDFSIRGLDSNLNEAAKVPAIARSGTNVTASPMKAR